MTSWGGYGKNVYYDPAACGLELVAVLDADLSYEFDIMLAVKSEDGVYLAHDVGCSCPTPFEDVRSLGDMTLVRTGPEVEAFVKANESYRPWSVDEVRDFVRKVEAVL